MFMRSRTRQSLFRTTFNRLLMTNGAKKGSRSDRKSLFMIQSKLSLEHEIDPSSCLIIFSNLFQTLTGDSARRQGIRQMLHVRGKLHRDAQQRRSQVGSIVAGAVMQKRLGIQFHGNSLQHRCHRGLFKE